MPGTVVVEAYGAEMVARELVSAGNRAADPRAFWPNIGRRLEDIEEQQFATDGARGPHGPWPPNTNEWQWYKFTHNMSLDLMKATEDMFAALTGETKDSVRDYSLPDRMRFGADLPQFAIHQSGAQPNVDKQRYPIDLTHEDEVEIAGAIMNFILGSAGTPAGRGSDFSFSKTGKRYYARRDSRGRFASRDV